MSLAIDYCKEIATELKQNAVYIPGTFVSVGDVINFNEGDILGPKPLGPFKKIINLTDLKINLATETDPENSHPSYIYASKQSVSVSFAADANSKPGEGKLTVNFSKEGSTYLSAVDCKETRFKNISGLKDMLAPYKNNVDWKHCFIVIGVTVTQYINS